NPDLLPNITLGFYAYDSCAVLPREIEGTLWMLTGNDRAIPNYRCRESPALSAVIGHSTSTYSMVMAHLLGLYRYPQVSYFSTSPLLSDRTQFPSFFRTVPSDKFQSVGLAQLVLHFQWTWIGLLAPDNDYGQEGIQVIKREIWNSGACVAFTEFIFNGMFFRDLTRIVKVMKDSTATVIVAFSTDIYMILILEEMLRQKVTGKLFVASEAWSISNVLSVEKYSSILTGTMGFAYHSTTIQGFEEYVNNIHPYRTPGLTWAKIFWEEAFGCKFHDEKNFTELPGSLGNVCTGDEQLESLHNTYNDVSSLRFSYNLYTAAHVIAQSLHDLSQCKDWGRELTSKECSTISNFHPWQLLHYIKKVRVKLDNKREVFFDENGDPPAVYDIVNWQRTPEGVIKPVKVGSYDTATSSEDMFSINTSMVRWPRVPLSICSESCPPGFRKVARRGEPICCFQCTPCFSVSDSVDCTKCPWDMWPNTQKDQCIPKAIEYLSYEEPLGMALASTSVSSSVIPVSIFSLFIHYKNTPIVRANNYALSCVLLISLSLCFLCSLAFIGYPQPEKCLLRQAAFGMVFTICVSCILAKTIMVVLAFVATKPGSSLKKWTNPRVSYMIVNVCSFIQLILCIVWLSLSPPFPQYNTQTQPGLIIVECNENSPTAFWFMLGYLGLLATISFVVAFLARRLPDSFNEAKFITFSMLAFLSVWVSYIPASLSARGKYTVAMEIFAIQSSSWALVVCMFAPKCFIIVFRPDMNSKEHLMGKTPNWPPNCTEW
uniref:G-protein coupled receptors family 3 profile domain-containing protein n=1 Tax=Leptobrachium leishanense TaxID=445787 RepID=A0A8C5MHP6_9ANUR